ncbi:hypothetical protein ABTX60_05460 [Streptomyces sp. NPDC126510]
MRRTRSEPTGRHPPAENTVPPETFDAQRAVRAFAARIAALVARVPPP